MKSNQMGQVSFEVIVAVGVLLMFLILILIHNASIEETRKVIDSTYREKNSCLSVMSVISKTYASGPGSESTLAIDYNLEIYGAIQTVKVNQEYCKFLARVDSNYIFTQGTIRITNLNGVVSIAQVS